MKANATISERELSEVIMERLRRLGFTVASEVPNMGQSADIVAQKNGRILTIEAKLGAWKRAIEQCRAHEQVADFIIIAIYSGRVSDKLIYAAKEHGYGILHCRKDQSMRLVLRPRVNRSYWMPQREIFQSNFRSVVHGS